MLVVKCRKRTVVQFRSRCWRPVLLCCLTLDCPVGIAAITLDLVSGCSIDIAVSAAAGDVSAKDYVAWLCTESKAEVGILLVPFLAFVFPHTIHSLNVALARGFWLQ